MTKEELENRIRILYQQLDIYRIYHEELVEQDGMKILGEKVNQALDEIILRTKQLKKLQSQKKKDDE